MRILNRNQCRQCRTWTYLQFNLCDGGVSFLNNFEVNISATYGEDLDIIIFAPNAVEYILLEATVATQGTGEEGEELADFDMGLVPGDGSLANAGPCLFVETGPGFTAPYSEPGVYKAEGWPDANGNFDPGDWRLLIGDAGAGDNSSIGALTIRYCGMCV